MTVDRRTSWRKDGRKSKRAVLKDLSDNLLVDYKKPEDVKIISKDR
jgi:hypothetical protein